MPGLRNSGPQAFGFPRKIDGEERASVSTNLRWCHNKDLADLAPGVAVAVTSGAGKESVKLPSAILGAYVRGVVVPVEINGAVDQFDGIADDEWGAVCVEGPVYCNSIGFADGDRLEASAAGDGTFAVVVEGTGVAVRAVALEVSEASRPGFTLIYLT